MNILRVGFVGTRTANFQQTTDFFQDVLGLPTAFTKPDWTGFRLPTGKYDFLEVIGPTRQDSNFFPDSAGDLMIAFIVDDIVGAHAELEAAGGELLGDVFWAGEGMGWFFLRAPDGNVYAIQQVPK